MKTIKYYRERQGLSQEELARLLGVDRSTVAKWESSGCYPHGGKILEIAKCLECTPNDLYSEIAPMHAG